MAGESKITEPPKRLRFTSDKQRYCTVSVTMVVCVKAPDAAVTATEAVPRWAEGLPPPHPTEASRVEDDRSNLLAALLCSTDENREKAEA
jgi:hypothetical protein